MMGIWGDETWTPDTDYEGAMQRVGIPRWITFQWDPEAEAPEGLERNWVETGEVDVVEVMCGTPLGAPAESC